MSYSFNAVTVTTAATQILAYRASRRGFIIKNNGSNIVYIGLDDGVTSSTGLPILPQDSFVLSDDAAVWRGKVYGITSSASSDVRFWDYTL